MPLPALQMVAGGAAESTAEGPAAEGPEGKDDPATTAWAHAFGQFLKHDSADGLVNALVEMHVACGRARLPRSGAERRGAARSVVRSHRLAFLERGSVRAV